MYDKMIDFSAIYKAYRKTSRGKYNKGEVIAYETNLHMNLWYLYQRLLYRKFRMGRYRRFMIYDPKIREIMTLQFSDRVFQQLLCENVLRPYFEARLIFDNAACQKEKGTHFALNRFTGFLRKYYIKYGTKGYILKFDIKKYFDSIDHEVLKNKLRKFPDRDVKNLIYHIIDSYEKTPGKGLPLGNQSSQWFALYYLDRLDRVVKEEIRIKYYSRYMDDGVMILETKEKAIACLKRMEEVIKEEKLEFNKKTQIFPISQGVDYLGWHFYMTDSGKVIKRLRTSNKRRFKRRLKAYRKKYEEGVMDISDVTLRVQSYRGHLKYGHTYKLRKKIYSQMIFKRKKLL